jgi:hypothetical protein
MRGILVVLTAIYCSTLATGCGGDDATGDDDVADDDPFKAKPECEGDAIVPFEGTPAMVISSLTIGTKEDGFDLDDNGTPDNKLSGVGPLAGPAMEDALAQRDIVLPMEFFDFPQGAPDECVKFAMYRGLIVFDGDGDERSRADDKRADCDDTDPTRSTDAAEVADDSVDNDCDGLADESVDDVPSTRAQDEDGDGVTIAGGDCDDRPDLGAAASPQLAEICDDGIDNDCDGAADLEGCNPFDLTPESIMVDALSFEDNGEPIIAFDSGRTIMEGSDLLLQAGPSVFSLVIPITDDIPLTLSMTGVRIQGTVVPVGEGLGIVGGRLGGVMDSYTLDQVRGLEVMEINLRPEDSMLDAMYANTLGVLLGFQRNEMGCMMPDIDIDGDGLEAFCDTTPDDEVNAIDLCIDGDGTEIRDEGGVQCTTAMVDGELRFADGVSMVMNFETVPTTLRAME